MKLINNNIEISVIVPCFNQGQFLSETLESVLNQTVTAWECLIIDDGSTDDTASIAKEWVLKDSRFSYYYKENGGLSSARNCGLKRANGVYVQLLDSDDLIEPEKFEKQLLDTKEAGISICDYVPFDHNTGEFNEHRYLSPFLTENGAKQDIIIDWEYRKSIPCHTVLFRKDIVDQHEITFNENLPNHEDWVFWTQLIYLTGKIKNRKEKLARYRIHSNSMSIDFAVMKEGFLKATNVLETFFVNHKDKEQVSLVKSKRREIKTRGKTSLFKKLRKRILARLSSYNKNVK